MATSLEFIEYVCEQIKGPYDVRYKKMFGEYILYLNNKPVFLICDNTIFVKKLKQLEVLMGDAECQVPYKGAKSHYVLDLDNALFLKKIITLLEEVTPASKPKK